MSKLTLNDISSGFQSNTAANVNNALIEQALENTLSRDGTAPNAMASDLDMDSHAILNASGLTINGVNVVPEGTTSVLASGMAFTPYGNISSITVQTAIQEEVDDLASSSGSSLVGFLQAGTGAVDRTLQDKGRDIKSFADFEAVGDGTTNDDVALAKIAALPAGTVIDGLGRTYAMTVPLVFANKIEIFGATLLALPAFPEAGIMARFNADESKINISIDGGSRAIVGVAVVGDKCKGSVTGKNITGSDTGGGTQSVLYLIGDNGDFSVHGEDLLLGTSTNPSVPRVLSVAPSTGNKIRHISGSNIQCMWTNQDGVVDCDFFSADYCGENGLYDVGTSSVVTIGTMIFNGNTVGGHTQTLVIKGECTVGDLIVNNCHGYAAVDAAGKLAIENYRINNGSTYTHQPIVSRAGTTVAAVAIGNLSGEYKMPATGNGGAVVQFFAGTVTDFTIGRCVLTMHWGVGDTSDLYVQTTGVAAGVSFGEIDLTLIDDSGTLLSSDFFIWLMPTFDYQSSVNHVVLRSSTATLSFRGAIQPNMSTPAGLEFGYSTSWHESLITDTNPRIFFSSAVPTAGTFRRGDIVRNKFPSSTNAHQWTCITAGTPGVWRMDSSGSFTGTTANRPTLTSVDIGVKYFDTTLAAEGKPVWWTGTVWVDATGTVV